MTYLRLGFCRRNAYNLEMINPFSKITDALWGTSTKTVANVFQCFIERALLNDSDSKDRLSSDLVSAHLPLHEDGKIKCSQDREEGECRPIGVRFESPSVSNSVATGGTREVSVPTCIKWLKGDESHLFPIRYHPQSASNKQLIIELWKGTAIWNLPAYLVVEDKRHYLCIFHNIHFYSMLGIPLQKSWRLFFTLSTLYHFMKESGIQKNSWVRSGF